jgi:hypothetical protein
VSTESSIRRQHELALHSLVLGMVRTASTQLHKARFNSDGIEKALVHEHEGVRRI